MKQTPRVLLPLVLALCGVAMLLFGTTWGAGLSPDSASYIGAARNLLHGRGLSTLSATGEAIPLTHYPPLFPALLAALGLLGLEPLDGARWLNCILFGGNILLTGRVIMHHTRSTATSAFGSMLVLLSVPMLRVHSMAWTEPAFLFFGLLGLFWLSEHLEHPRPGLLAAASGAVALAFLARYAGLVLVATGVIALVAFRRPPRRDALRDGGVFVLLSCLPTVLWLIRNVAVADTMTNRQATFHPLTLAGIHFALRTVSEWIWPGGAEGGLAALSLALALLAVALTILAFRERPGERSRGAAYGIGSLVAIVVVIYAFFLAVSVSFFDAHTVLDNRILSPVYAWGLVGIVCSADRRLRARAVRPLLLLVGVVFGVSHLIVGARWLGEVHRNGQGYASEAWRNSETVQRVRALPRGIPIFSNGDDVIYMLTDRPAGLLPARVSATSRRTNDHYLADLARMHKILAEQNGVVVYFAGITWRWYLPLETELSNTLPMRMVFAASDGAIYTIDHERQRPTPP